MRSRLVLLSVAVTSMVVVAFSIPLGLLIQDLARDRAVSGAEREANALARTLAVLGDVGDLTVEALIGGADDGVRLGVVVSDGHTVGDVLDMGESAADALSGRSFLVDESSGVAAYVPVVGLDQPTAVRAWIGPDELRRNVMSAWIVLGSLGLLLIGLAAVLADRLGQSMVRPVEDLAEATERLGEGDLSVSVEPRGPSELVAVGRSFNRLVERIRGLLNAERESVADLSHRLRTPLTALRLNAESLGSEEVIDDVERLERTVDAVIAEARRPIRHATEEPANLVDVVRERATFWQPLAADQARTIDVTLPGHAVVVDAVSDDVVTAVDALLENVFAHTEEGSAVEIVVETSGQLVVSDRGQGFRADQMIARGVSGGGGTGLGLDIVRQTAHASGGSLAIESRPGGGSQITVRFGLAD